MRGTKLPAFCLTCGYSEVPMENFNRHECSDFRALPKAEQDANEDASMAETLRRINYRKAPK